MALDLSHLNAPQREAVEHRNGPMLVLAGAGSGKTRVVTYRTARLLASGVDPSRIVVVTFTNKAAAEMRGRILGLVPQASGRDLTLTTFHAFGARLLRAFIDRLGFQRSFTILDQSDQQRLIKSALEELKLADTGAKPDAIQQLVSLAKRRRTTPAHLKEARHSAILPYAQRVYESYNGQLKALNAVDFDDLLGLPLRLRDEVPEVREIVGSQYQFVMVDEFQDTNATQLQLLQWLAPHNNMMAVGDDDQSIYAFQGALADNILTFERHFPGTKIVKLEQSYRSHDRILKAANAVISHNRTRHSKTLWSARQDGPKIRYTSVADEREEANFVVRDMQNQHDRDGVPFEAFAILYRINSQARLFEEALRLANVPYRVIGSTELFDKTEVRDWLAYLSVLANPRDELSLRRILNVPRRGLGSVAVTQLEQAAQERGRRLGDMLADAEGIDGLGSVATQGALGLARLLGTWRPRLFGARRGELVEQAKEFLAATGLPSHVRKTEKNAAIAEHRIELVGQLIDGMAETPAPSDLLTYLSSMSLHSHATDRNESEGRGVTLLTLHSAKGLEFPRVYLVGFERELLPHKRSMDHPAALAEERRLCYVGMTRAMDRLTLTAARTRTKRNERLPRRPSSFLEEIPAELIDSGGDEPMLEGMRRDRNRSYLAQIQELLAGKGQG